MLETLASGSEFLAGCTVFSPGCLHYGCHYIFKELAVIQLVISDRKLKVNDIVHMCI